MGYARIISGGPDGRYTIELDYGQSTRDALLAATNSLLAQLDVAISTLLVRVAAADAAEAAQIAKVQAAEAALISATTGGLPPGASKPDTAGFRFEVRQLTELRAANAPLRFKLQSLQFERAQAVRRAAYWQAFNPIETRSAWCADLTEDAPAGSYVATVDIPGESNLILIAPGAREWTPSDGELTAREIMSPAQAFLNAAILPGVQKFRPTYRWGTITAINYSTDRCSVSLAPAVSSAQGLGVNLVSSLTNVPVVYSTCNAGAFNVGDRVVVEFVGQSWTSPRVIGFLDNPKACAPWPLVRVSVAFSLASRTSNPPRSWIVSTSFNAACGVTQVLSSSSAAITADTATHEAKIASIELVTAPPGASLTSSVPIGELIYTANSSAFEFSGSAVPAVDVGTWVFASSASPVNLRIATINSSVVTLGAGYNSSCVPATMVTGGLVSSSSEVDLVNYASLEAWLTALGKLPTINVTIGGRTRPYRPIAGTTSNADTSTPGPGHWRWVMTYEAEPGT